MSYQGIYRYHQEYPTKYEDKMRHIHLTSNSAEHPIPVGPSFNPTYHIDSSENICENKDNRIFNSYSEVLDTISPESRLYNNTQNTHGNDLLLDSSLNRHQHLHIFHQMKKNNLVSSLDNSSVLITRDTRGQDYNRKISSHSKRTFRFPYRLSPEISQGFMSKVNNNIYTKLPFLPSSYTEIENMQITKEEISLQGAGQDYAPNQFDIVPRRQSPGKNLDLKCKKELELDAASTLCHLSRVEPTIKSEGKMKSKSRKSKSVQDHPTRLSTPNDETELNSLHCFVRQELLELFFYKKEERSVQSLQHDSEEDSITKNGKLLSHRNDLTMPIFIASPLTDDDLAKDSLRVGFRCVYCAHLDKIQLDDSCQSTNMRMNAFYPKSLGNIYRLVCKWQRIHFKKCKQVPLSVKKNYEHLKASDKTRGKTSYWVSSAIELGLVDDTKPRGGIRYNSTKRV